MITRGHFIGEIVDEFAAISTQVKMRNALGLTDLTVYTENFMRDVLNIIESLKLLNLNSKRSNEPGIDLGDTKARTAFQITSNASKNKVNETLKKITDQQLGRYANIVVLAVGSKQGSYTLDPAGMARCNFDESHIWDLNDLARKVVSLEIEVLQRLHRLIRANMVRLRIELEVPDEDGKYQNHSEKKWEPPAQPVIGDGKAFAAFQGRLHGAVYSDAEFDSLVKALHVLSEKLANLPRMTRQFLARLCEFSTVGDSKRCARVSAHVLFSKVQKRYLDDDLEGELEILHHDGFIRLSLDNVDMNGPGELGIILSSENEALTVDFLRFIKDRNLDIQSVIGDVDLSAF